MTKCKFDATNCDLSLLSKGHFMWYKGSKYMARYHMVHYLKRYKSCFGCGGCSEASGYSQRRKYMHRVDIHTNSSCNLGYVANIVIPNIKTSSKQSSSKPKIEKNEEETKILSVSRQNSQLQNAKPKPKGPAVNR